MNGSPVEIEGGEGGNLGETLARADEMLEKAGSVIVSMTIDGEQVDAESYAAFAERSCSSTNAVEIVAEDAAAVRIRALDTLLELLDIASRLATGDSSSGGEDGTAEDWRGLREGAGNMRDAFEGLFAADELSFVQLFVDVLSRAGDDPDAASRVELAAQADRLRSVFGERLAELRSPVEEMRTAAALFEEGANDLAELPVLLQTGKEDQAMKAVLYFIEIFNKVIRILPELRSRGVDTQAISIEGTPLPEFYTSFNGVLKELIEAFEHKDAVLIGDLAEYEVLPRMRGFFAAMKEALPAS